MARRRSPVRQTARKSAHDPFEQNVYYDSEDDYDDSDEEIDAPVHAAEPAARADGWDLKGDWAITTNDTNYGDTNYGESRGPFIWSCYVSGGVSYMSFDVGFLRGVAKLDKALTDILPPRRNKAKFTWRGRETGEGEMQINDSRQTGEVTFKQQAGGFLVLEGVLHGPYCSSEGLRFIGSRVKATPSRTSQTWASYNARAYERERVGRWG